MFTRRLRRLCGSSPLSGYHYAAASARMRCSRGLSAPRAHPATHTRGRHTYAVSPHNSPIYDWAKLLSMRRIKSDYLPGEKSRARARGRPREPSPRSRGSLRELAAPARLRGLWPFRLSAATRSDGRRRGPRIFPRCRRVFREFPSFTSSERGAGRAGGWMES